MEMKGTPIAKRILDSMRTHIQSKGLTPHLAIIHAGDDPSSTVYIQKKKMVGQQIGIEVTVYHFSSEEEQDCAIRIKNLNLDQSIDGIIVQLPLYPKWNTDKMIHMVDAKKDVDGFIDRSPFVSATAQGVWEMLGAFARHEGNNSTESFLEGKSIVVVGKGTTAGKPIAELLQIRGITPTVVDSKFQYPDTAFRSADIIISATGRKHIIHKDNIKKGSYIIGIGLGTELVNGEKVVFGDIHPNIAEKAKIYCPSIGGIGPLTVACLLRNVMQASENAART